MNSTSITVQFSRIQQKLVVLRSSEFTNNVYSMSFLVHYIRRTVRSQPKINSRHLFHKATTVCV